MVLVAQSCQTLCDPTDCSLPGSSVHGISWARILERVAIFFSRGSSRPRDGTHVSCTAGRLYTAESAGKPASYPRAEPTHSRQRAASHYTNSWGIFNYHYQQEVAQCRTSDLSCGSLTLFVWQALPIQCSWRRSDLKTLTFWCGPESAVCLHATPCALDPKSTWGLCWEKSCCGGPQGLSLVGALGAPCSLLISSGVLLETPEAPGMLPSLEGWGNPPAPASRLEWGSRSS